MENMITLTIVTPEGSNTVIQCDSVRLTIADGIRKKNAGGSFGIRKGHADALLAIAEGPVKALVNGETVFECTTGPGFASVSGKNTVSVLTDRLTIRKDCPKP